MIAVTAAPPTRPPRWACQEMLGTAKVMTRLMTSRPPMLRRSPPTFWIEHAEGAEEAVDGAGGAEGVAVDRATASSRRAEPASPADEVDGQEPGAAQGGLDLRAEEVEGEHVGRRCATARRA